MTRARTFPPRSTMPSTVGFASRKAATARTSGSLLRGFPPHEVSSTSTSPDRGSSPSSVISSVRIFFIVR